MLWTSFFLKKLIYSSDKKLSDKMTLNMNNPLHELSPNKLGRPPKSGAHRHKLIVIRRERFKNSHMNSCLVNYILIKLYMYCHLP